MKRSRDSFQIEKNGSKRHKGGEKIENHIEKDNNKNEGENESSVLDNIKIHPLLKMPVSNLIYAQKNDKTAIKNPLKNNNWKQREGYIMNPYIDQNDYSLVPVRPNKTLKFNEKGKYIAKGKEYRESMREEMKLKEEREKLAELNLIPDRTLGEEMYAPIQPPAVEWWDIPFLKDKGYENIDKLERITYKDPESEDNPITIYIQHPIPLEAPWERFVPKLKPLYLTKKELKRLRKNDRSIRLKEKQDRIKLGLDPTPAPKVKLKNLMNVLTNETIKNPTEVEMRIKKEIKDRKTLHDKMNQDRKLTKEQKNEKLELKYEQDLQKGIYGCVFNVKRLANPKNVYKVDINSKQLRLTGVCLSLKGRNSLIIVEGTNKSVEKYKKLLMHRINWEENEAPKKRFNDYEEAVEENKQDKFDELEDLSGNKCELLWEGRIVSNKFQKWTSYNFNQENEVLDFLEKYELDNYWRQAAITLDSVF